jgi:hypothetical protein
MDSYLLFESQEPLDGGAHLRGTVSSPQQGGDSRFYSGSKARVLSLGTSCDAADL